MAQLATLPRISRPRGPSWQRALLWLIVIGSVLFMLLPLLATIGFSLATVWSKTILPEGYTLDWYRAAVSDDRFRPTVLRSLKVVIAASIISPLIVTPAVLAIHLKTPRLKPWVEFLSIIPWALPGVVLALAMIRTYISPYNVDRPTLLVLTYVLLSLPFMFRAIDGALSAINARQLVDAAQMLGAGWVTIAWRILAPNVMPGILSGVLLVAALAAGEYALAALMVGSGWKTFPIYQAQMQSVDGRIASALAVFGLLFTFIISMVLIFTSGRTRRGRGAAGVPVANK